MGENNTSGDAPGAAEFVPPVQEIVDVFLKAAKEADGCIKTGNKAQGRRARKLLSDVKKAITPLRQAILDVMKGKPEQGPL